MEGYSRKDEVRPQLLDLIPKGRVWLDNNRNEERSQGSSEEKKLELRLGPPGEEEWSIKDASTKNNYRERGDESLLSLGYFSNMTQNTNTTFCGAKRGFLDIGTVVGRKTLDEDSWIKNHNGSQTHNFSSSSENPSVGTRTVISSSSPWSSSHYQQSLPPVMGKESSQQQACCTKVVDLQNAEKKAFSPASANTAVPNSSQKRTSPAPVVGWPPIRSFRKNLASSSSSKLPLEPETQNVVPNKIGSKKQAESCGKGLFVKINMDGILIGRKVDLKAYDSYEKLSCAVDELFRGLLAAQIDSSGGKIQNNQEGEKAIKGLLDGSGEFTLVYEDNEGDRMLVGDVPWHMFVSTVKRLRVLKSSELSSLFIGSKQARKEPT